MDTQKYWWTYASGNEGIAYVHRHNSREAAESHYYQMRTVGGPRHIGVCRKPITEARMRKALATEYAECRVSWPTELIFPK